MNYYQNKRPEVIPFIKEKHYKNILEIGCGAGFFAANINSIDRWGIEPEKKIAEQAESILDRVINSTFDEAYDQLPDNYFDLIIINDVLEHMTDHYGFLKKIKSKMTHGAYIIGSIPNLRYYDVLKELLLWRDFLYRDAGILDYTHHRFFTKRSIIRMFEENNFLLDKFEGINKLPHWCGGKNKKYTIPLKILAKVCPKYFEDMLYLQYGFRVRLNH